MDDGTHLYFNYFTISGQVYAANIALYPVNRVVFIAPIVFRRNRRPTSLLRSPDVYRCCRLCLFRFENKQIKCAMRPDWMFSICLRCCRMTMTSRRMHFIFVKCNSSIQFESEWDGFVSACLRVFAFERFFSFAQSDV